MWAGTSKTRDTSLHEPYKLETGDMGGLSIDGGDVYNLSRGCKGKWTLGTNVCVPRFFIEGRLPRRKLKHVAGPIASTSSSVLLDPTCRRRLPKTWPSKERRLERFNFSCHSGQEKGQKA